MFTGLVEESGRVVACTVQGETARLTVTAPHVSVGAQPGDSIAVNGCCLTVVEQSGADVTFDVVPETLARTNLGALRPDDAVNLERPLAANGRLGGHFVQGHIDGVGTIRAITPEQNAVVFDIEVPAALSRYIVEKGSIAIDGISLTVAAVDASGFRVWIIPHTLEITTLGQRKFGDRVNLECDLLGKYIERMLLERGDIAPVREAFSA